jgi:hypothetical protein
MEGGDAKRPAKLLGAETIGFEEYGYDDAHG